MSSFELGESIPPDTAHAVSVSLPSWRANVGYEEGDPWVVSKMTTGYPRFFIHKSIQAFADDIVARFGQPQQSAMLFPTKATSARCIAFVKEKAPPALLAGMRVVNLVLDPSQKTPGVLQYVLPAVSAVLYTPDAFPFFKQYWQHSGDGVSSRRAEFCHGLLKDGLLVLENTSPSPSQPVRKVHRGPRRYQRPSSLEDATDSAQAVHSEPPREGSSDEAHEAQESSQFLEERFGRNLNISLVKNAKSAIRRRIAGVLEGDIDLDSSFPTMDSNARGVSNFKENDIYLLPCGMKAIFNTHQTLLKACEPRKSISYGFPYVDTLKILEKWGPGCLFYGHGSSQDLDDLESRLKNGERFLALFCEFPGNPLLSCPDLKRIRRLADTYDFAVVVDETIGTFVNINVLPFADVVVSSLTKIFSGDCNVMGGAIVLNPGGKYYDVLKRTMNAEFEDTYWAEDILFLERNSRDFITRIDRINDNAEAICDILRAHPNVNKVYFPKYNESRPHYDACKTPNGGYGGLLSCTFQNQEQAVRFFDALDTAKGPSLGTNFTLTSPYVLLAHYQELDWAASMGVNPDLVRISVGLEDPERLKVVFTDALKATENLPHGSA